MCFSKVSSNILTTGQKYVLLKTYFVITPTSESAVPFFSEELIHSNSKGQREAQVL